ncbi:hypothetical protein [uncultured Chryseobacterium sp.]|uniref:hypothetical protein n=1 Tax=uncultured Chryseobacterium sp. TaxID=259322 RepID=UPI0025CBECC2|nr:hypothetical protein [uncultured Chryseobacterium sp.]
MAGYKIKDKSGWGLIGIGAGAIGIGIPFAIGAKKICRKQWIRRTKIRERMKRKPLLTALISGETALV